MNKICFNKIIKQGLNQEILIAKAKKRKSIEIIQIVQLTLEFHFQNKPQQ
jgi:hypothetical protein